MNNNTHFEEKLRSAGLRPTKQRLKMCEILFDRKRTFHFTIEDLRKILKKKLDIYKLKKQSFEKTKLKKNKKNFMVNLDESNHFQKPIYLNLLTNHFYLSENDMFLGGCFVVKNEGILKCKLQSYYNVFNGKLPLACN